MRLFGKTWLRRLLLLLLLAGLGLTFIVRCTRTVERWVERSAGKELGGQVSLPRLRFDGPSTLVLEQPAARLRDAASDFFGARSVRVELTGFPPRPERIEIEGVTLVATERADGTFDLSALGGGSSGPTSLPRTIVRDALLELRGEGPLHRRLAGILAPAVPRRVHVKQVELTTVAGGRFQVEGEVVAGELADLAVSALLRADGRPEQVVLRIGAERPLDLGQLAAATAPAIGDRLRANRLAGPIAGEVRIDGRGAAVAVEADIELLGITATPAAFPSTVADARGRLELRGNAISWQDVQGHHDGARLQASGSVTGLDGDHVTHLVLRCDGGTIDAQLLAALEKDAIGRDLVAAFAPEGRYSVVATIDAAAHVAEVGVALDLELLDTACVFHGFPDETGVRRGFPLRVDRIRGSVHSTPDETRFENVVGFTAGGARVECSGHLLGGRLEGRVAAFGAALDAEFLAAAEQATGPMPRQVVERLGLRGTFDVEAPFSLVRHGAPLELVMTARPRRLTVCPPEFPLAFDFDSGAIVLDRAQVRFEAVRGSRGRATARVDGFLGIAADDDRLDLTLEVRDLPLDEELTAASRALPDGWLARILDALGARGRLDLVTRLRRDEPGGPLALDVTITPIDGGLRLGLNGPVVADLRGDLRLRQTGEEPWQAEVAADRPLSGTLFGGTVELDGAFGEDGSGELRLIGRRVVLDEEVAKALDALAPELADLLRSHHVRGRVRFECGLQRTEAGLVPRTIDVAPDVAPDAGSREEEGVAIDPPWLHLDLGWTGGTMQVDFPSRTVMLSDVVGRLGGGALTVPGGTISIQDEGITATLATSIDALPFAEFVELLLGPAGRAVIAPMGPLGTTSCYVPQLAFHLPAGTEALDRFEARGRVELDGWTFYTGGALKELTGSLEVSRLEFGRSEPGLGGLFAEAQLSGTTVDLRALRFANLGADIAIQSGRLLVSGLAAEFAGGRLVKEKNRIEVMLSEGLPFEGHLELLEGNLARLLGDDAPRGQTLAGRIDAELGFKGSAGELLRGEGMVNLEAGGQVKVSNARLWSVPLFDQLYFLAIRELIGGPEVDPMRGAEQAQADAEELPRFERGELEFALRGPEIHLRRIELESEPLVLRGKGTLGADRLSFTIYPELKAGLGLVRSVPILGWIAGGLLSFVQREVAAFRFHGPYGAPKVDWDPLSVLPRPDLDIGLDRPRLSPRRSTVSDARF